VLLLVSVMPGLWLVSSMAVHLGGGAPWVAVLAMLLVLPGLPLLWEGFAAWRRGDAKAHLKTADRMLLRTLAVSVAVVALSMLFARSTSLKALTQQGAWFLEGVDAPAARNRILSAARWLSDALGSDASPTPVVASASASASGAPSAAPTVTASASASSEATGAETGAPEWPLEAKPHHVVDIMKKADETSIEVVAKRLAGASENDFEAAKGLHDWVATRVAFDSAAYKSNKPSLEKAAEVFRERKAVGLGFATLLAAMGKAAGLEMVVIRGEAKDDAGVQAEHAWNGVRIGRRWYLVDAAWDAGYIANDFEFEHGYGTEYLFIPPEVLQHTHRPDDQRWQLIETPRSPKEFERAAYLTPRFVRLGLKLAYPTEAVAVDGDVTVEVQVPATHEVLIGYWRNGVPPFPTECETSGTTKVKAVCKLPKGRHRVVVALDERRDVPENSLELRWQRGAIVDVERR
ncbi:MAG: hypothetical protein JRI68_14310, partial [Deltaproteobacteria bacterium]|nr:hypothetical protein [Deltaproteobacteria bacterium]